MATWLLLNAVDILVLRSQITTRQPLPTRAVQLTVRIHQFTSRAIAKPIGQQAIHNPSSASLSLYYDGASTNGDLVVGSSDVLGQSMLAVGE